MFSDVTTAPDGTVYGVQRPAANRLVFGRVLPSGFAPSTQVELATSHIVYPRIAMGGPGSVVCVCVTGHDDHVRLVTSAGLQRDLGVVASGGQPVAIRSGMFGGVEVAMVLTPGGSRYDTLGIDTGLAFATPSIDGPFGVPLPDGNTAGGFLDWVDAFVWTDTNRVQIVGGRKLVYPMRRGDWTVGQDGEGPNRLLAYHHPTGAWFVVPGWSQYPPRLAARPDGSCVVAVSSGVGEFVESSRFTPLPADVPAEVAAIGRPLWLAWFEFARSLSTAPCNAVLPVFTGAPWLVLETLDGTPIARYVAGDPDGDLDALERAIARAKADRIGLPVLAYWPLSLQRGRLPVGADIIGVEAYRKVDETPQAFARRVVQAAGSCPRAMLIAQAYSSNATNTSDLQSIPAVVAAIARDCPSVEGIVGFSGSGRPTGYQDHPEIHAAWRALFAGITGAPALPVVPTPIPEPPAPSPQPAPVPAPTSRFPRARSLSHA